MRLRFLLGVLAVCLAGGPDVYAAERGVQVEVARSCTNIDRAQLTRLLNVEQRREADSNVGQAQVSVSCEGALVTLRVEERDATTPPRTRTLAAADVSGEIGARVLSLAAIELLDSRQPRPSSAAPTRPEPPPQAVRAELRRARPPSVRLMLSGSAQSFGGARPLLGGGLSVDYLRLAKLGLRLEFDVGIAEHGYETGRARVQLATLSAQAGYLAWYEAWSARAFVGYRFGSARIAGEAAPGAVIPVGTVTGPCGGPLISGGLGLRSGSWLAELGVEAGLVSFPLEGTIAGHEPLALDRYWLGLSLNVGVLL